MRIENISAHEADFDLHHKDSSEKAFSYSDESEVIPGESLQMDYVMLKPLSGDQSFYYASQHKKIQIVLHFTVGYLKGDIASLTHHDYHVSVPYVIGRNGIIYNLFSPENWAFHLGPGAVGGNETGSKRTIGIELSNIGGLNQTTQGMQNYYGEIYCNNNQYTEFTAKPFRRFTHFANFTDAQYNSLNILLHYLTSRFQIKRDFLPPDERFKTADRVKDYNGIVSHINYRYSGKEDIGPAFDWDRVIMGLNQPLSVVASTWP
jgi:N-acetyl-anhydromuramyl-L-alanine amidase AmpD